MSKTVEGRNAHSSTLNVVSEGEKDHLFVGSVEKAFMVLETFGSGRRDLGITEIMVKTGLDKSAAQRYTHTLHRLGYLQKDEASRRYNLSHKVLGMANNFLRVDPLVARATPYIADLRNKSNCFVGLGCLHNNRIMFVLPLYSSKVAYSAGHPGVTVPLYCTSAGRVLLSFKSDHEVREILESTDRTRITPQTITDIDEIIREIQKVRDQGYCITDQEWKMGQINLAVPLLSQSGPVAGALVMVSNRQEWTRKRFVNQMVPIAMETAGMIMSD